MTGLRAESDARGLSPRVPSSSADLGLRRLSRFETLDFGSLWQGRDRMHRAEACALSSLLGGGAHRRVLEVGAGEGRLTPTVSSVAGECVAVDGVPGFVAKIPSVSPEGRRVDRAAANLYRLPFADAAFDAVVLIRVYNFLRDPREALREFARIVAPGGSLVLSYHPRPSLESLAYDLRRGLRRRWGEHYRSSTWGRSLGSSSTETGDPWPPTRAQFAATVAEPWTRESEIALGLEDYRGLRSMPDSAVRALTQLLARSDVLPMRMVRLRRSGARGALPRSDEVLACPRCHRRPAPGEWGFDRGGECAGCGLRLPRKGGVLDARYAPEDEPA